MVTRSLPGRAQPGGSIGRRCLRRFRTIGGRRYAVLLSAQAFTTLLPLMIVLATIAAGVGEASRFANWVVRFFRLSGQARDVVHQFLARPPDAATGIEVIGDALLLLGAFMLAQLLRSILEETWGLPKALVRGSFEAVAAMLLLLAEALLTVYLATVLGHGLGGLILGLLLRTGAAAACWALIQWLLLDRRVGWRHLVPGAIVLGVAQTLVAEGSRLVMPGIISGQSYRYGIAGVALALLSWLSVICTVLVVGFVIGAELVEGRRSDPSDLDRRQGP